MNMIDRHVDFYDPDAAIPRFLQQRLGRLPRSKRNDQIGPGLGEHAMISILNIFFARRGTLHSGEKGYESPKN